MLVWVWVPPTHNCNEVAISLAQSANITVAIGNNITHSCVHITYIAVASAQFEQCGTLCRIFLLVYNTIIK